MMPVVMVDLAVFVKGKGRNCLPLYIRIYMSSWQVIVLKNKITLFSTERGRGPGSCTALRSVAEVPYNAAKPDEPHSIWTVRGVLLEHSAKFREVVTARVNGTLKIGPHHG